LFNLCKIPPTGF